MRADRVTEPGVVTRFRREGELLLRLSHPNIVRAYEIGDTPIPYLLEEAISGNTLASLLGRRGLGWDDLLNLADQLTAALAYLHDQNILHLDLKPSNIIAEAGRAKLIDFNLAHCPALGPADWGTPGYFAPEQELGGMFSTATDVWGLGVVLKEAAGRRVPAKFRDLMDRCQAADPSDRPTVAEFRAYLATCLGQPHFTSSVADDAPVAAALAGCT